MMYKVMLVDDEILVRERISKRIPWEDLGYCLTAVCENGKEAVDFLQAEDVDLILTDICMPYMDGLELAKYVYEEKKGAKIIILSGYDEFSYAKEAVKYQALSYVLKPVTASELMKVLAEAKEKLDEVKTEHQVKSVYLDSLEILRSQLLMQLASGNLPEGAWEERSREYGISFLGERYCAIAAFFQEPPGDYSLRQMAGWIGKTSGDALAFEGLAGNLMVFVKKSNNKLLMEEARRICRELAGYAKGRLQQKASCFIGTCVSELQNICVSCQNAFAMKEFMYLEKEAYIYEWDFYQKHKWDIERISMDKEREQRIVLAVRSNLKEDVRKELQEFQRECQERWITRSRAVITLQGMIFAVMASLSQINMEEDEGLFLKEQECMFALFKCSYLSEMKEIALRFFEEAADVMSYSRANYGERQAAMALDYIEKHYADPELSLGALCQELAISISYFSTIFKEFAGKTFIEALTERRMETARELLGSQSLKMYEVAEKCGYKDSSYFSVAFKKYYGMAPREFARKSKKR